MSPAVVGSLNLDLVVRVAEGGDAAHLPAELDALPGP